MNEHRDIQKMSKQTKVTRCLIRGNLCNLRATKFFRFNDVVSEQRFRSVGQVDCEKERAAGSEYAGIASHGWFADTSPLRWPG